jgi:SpoVK/Ycf46/Vps4 family AAA+-type ATPase
LHYQLKIVEVEPKTLVKFRIDNVHTALSQKSSISDKWIWQRGDDDGEKNSAAVALGRHVKHVERIIQFYDLNHQNDKLLPILLLHGPSGCGKTRCLEGVCSSLSLHLCKVIRAAAADGEL